MMKGRSGEVLWDDTIRLGIELRKKLRAIRAEFEEKEKDPLRCWFLRSFRAGQRFDPPTPPVKARRTTLPGSACRPINWRAMRSSGNCPPAPRGMALLRPRLGLQSPIPPSSLC